MQLQNHKLIEIWTGFKWSNHLNSGYKFFQYSNDSGIGVSGIQMFTVYMLYSKYLYTGHSKSRYIQKPGVLNGYMLIN